MTTAPQPCDIASRVDELRVRFKAQCQATDQRHQNWQIRVHRALSWLARAGETDADSQLDGRLLFAWIAFNALYGTWDAIEGYPARDGQAWREFLRRVLGWDQGGKLAARLVALREPILGLLANKFLDPAFWRDPGRGGNYRRRYHQAQSLYFEQRWLDVLTFGFERIYVLRGQLVHGAATRGSRLNRGALEQARLVLEGLLEPILVVAVDEGAHDDWPPLCYPPIDEAAGGPCAGAASAARTTKCVPTERVAEGT